VAETSLLTDHIAGVDMRALKLQDWTFTTEQ